MGVLTGENARIAGMTCWNRWQLQWREDAPGDFSACADGGEVLSPGNEDWNVEIEAFGPQPAKLIGDGFTFEGGDGGSKATGTCMVSRNEIYWPVGEGKKLHHRIVAEGAGQLTFASGTPSVSASPNPKPASGLKATIGGTEFAIFQGRLVLLALNAPYNDSETGPYTGRSRGNCRALLDVEMYFDDYEALPTRNSFVAASLATDDSNSWTLQTVRILDVKTDIAKSDARGYAVHNVARVTGQWSAWNGSSAGTITAPDGTVIWPWTS